MTRDAAKMVKVGTLLLSLNGRPKTLVQHQFQLLAAGDVPMLHDQTENEMRQVAAG